MKNILFSVVLTAAISWMFMSCGHDHGPDSHTHDDEHSHDDATPVLESLSFTKWTQQSELFVEFPPLIVNQESRFAAHFSNMANFKAIQEGAVKVRLRSGDQIIAEHKVDAPSSPGIFRPLLVPTNEGQYALDFILEAPGFKDTITLNEIIVYADEPTAIAANPAVPEGDEVSFLKEQAWKVDFGIEQVKRQPIHQVIHSSGEFLPIKGQSKIIAAKNSGVVFFKSRNLETGRDVRNGEQLFTIKSDGLLKANLEQQYTSAQAREAQTKMDFERAQKLIEKQIIGLKELEKRQMDYDVAKAELKSMTVSYSTDGQSLSSTMSGLVKNVMVTNGQFVTVGTPLVEITSSRRLMLQADVPQKHLSELAYINSANFKTAYQNTIQSIDNYNGRLVSYGKSTIPGTGFIPVIFELDNINGLISGSFAELFLLTRPISNQLTIPMSSIMQDYNINYVYVQTGGESFEKREIQIGINDGQTAQVISGIEDGEWIVSRGAYHIKMASMSSTIPAHGHAH